MNERQQIRDLSEQIYALTKGDLSTWAQDVRAWSQAIYDASPDVVVPPDPTAAKITLYEHDNYGGAVMGTVGAIPNFANIGFNDKASSAVVVGRWECFADANYIGKRLVLEPGSYPSLRALGFNDSISSVRPAADVTVPTSRVGKERKEFFGFTAKVGDLAETRGHVTAVWDHCWGDPQNSTRQLVEAQMPAIGEFAPCVFDGNRYRGDPAASAALRAMFNAYKQVDVLKYLIKLYIDEPSIPYAAMAQGVSMVRRIMTEYPELVRTRMAVCFGDYGSGREDYYCMDLFDDIFVDAYGERAGIVEPGGRMDRMIAQMGPDQRAYPSAGVNTEVALLSPDELNRIVDYVLNAAACGGMEIYTWFDRVTDGGGLGARSNSLRQPCIDAGMRFIAWNNALSIKQANQTGDNA